MPRNWLKWNGRRGQSVPRGPSRKVTANMYSSPYAASRRAIQTFADPDPLDASILSCASSIVAVAVVDYE